MNVCAPSDRKQVSTTFVKFILGQTDIEIEIEIGPNKPVKFIRLRTRE